MAKKIAIKKTGGDYHDPYYNRQVSVESTTSVITPKKTGHFQYSTESKTTFTPEKTQTTTTLSNRRPLSSLEQAVNKTGSDIKKYVKSRDSAAKTAPKKKGKK